MSASEPKKPLPHSTSPQPPPKPRPEFSLSGLPLYGRAATTALRARLHAHGIFDPVVRFEYAAIPDGQRDYPAIEVKPRNVWLIHSSACHILKNESCSCTPYKVQKKRSQWTCSCDGWKKHRRTPCVHIKRVRAIAKEDGITFSTERRRPLTRWVYPKEELTESARRMRAYEVMDTRVSELLVNIIERFVIQPVRERKGGNRNGGAIGLPLQATVYAFLMKIFDFHGYHRLRNRLHKDENFRRLGWKKLKSPRVTTLGTRFGKKELIEAIERLLPETARSGRLIDNVVLVDATETPATATGNARDLKFGPKPPSYRKRKITTKTHYATGKITNFIAAADITLTSGLASSDGIHLESLLRKAKDPLPRLDEAVADQGYEGKMNWSKAELLGVTLYIREKKNEDRLNPKNKWPPIARRIAALERAESPEFEDHMRWRPKAELTGSRGKRQNHYNRFRSRNNDPTPNYPEGLVDADDVKLSELPEDILSEVLQAATTAVGYARRSEATGTCVIQNLRAHVLLEELTGQWIDLTDSSAFKPFRNVREEDVM